MDPSEYPRVDDYDETFTREKLALLLGEAFKNENDNQDETIERESENNEKEVEKSEDNDDFSDTEEMTLSLAEEQLLTYNIIKRMGQEAMKNPSKFPSPDLYCSEFLPILLRDPYSSINQRDNCGCSK